ncbi:DUF932 domain-containing protein [Massilia putida]|uniref:DUF932 domain-containing protein n=1 Tax=Massilia putida TaxID=1141883 RepID=UPI00095171D7|nr:DUF932 domain-containing protein [Massilia putida]
MKLATRFGRNNTSVRSSIPLTNDEIRLVAPSIFAEEKHDSRSERYTYIPTIHVLDNLRKEGFEPFMACQAKCRDEGKREFTKHMLRLRHASQITTGEANEIILLNSHDGTSSYQMLAGTFRFVCSNGMVCGDTLNDIRIHHKGNVVDNVIEGAFRVVDDFERIDGQIVDMKSLTLNQGEQQAFAHAALALKYDTEIAPAPITERQILTPKRRDDAGDDLWRTFNRVQERMLQGGVPGRAANGRNMTTRAVTGIDQGIKLNRALWLLAEKMKELKA